MATNRGYIGISNILVTLEGTLTDPEKIVPGLIQFTQLICQFSSHQEDIGITHDNGLNAIVVTTGVRMTLHPFPAIFTEIPLLDTHQFLLVIRIPAPVHAGDVTTDVVGVVFEPHGRHRTGIAATGYRSTTGVLGTFRAHREGVIPTAAAIGKRNHEQGLVTGTCCQIVVVTLVLPVSLKVFQGSGTGGNGFLQIGQRLGIQDIVLQLGVVGEAVLAQITGSHHTVFRTLGITGSHQGNAGIQALGEHLVHTVRTQGSGTLSGIRQIRDSLVQVGKQLLEDVVTAGLGHIDGFAGSRRETGRDIAPGTYQVIVNHGAEREGFTQEIGHIGFLRRISILANAFNNQVGALDGFVHLGEGTVFQVQLAVVGRQAISGNLILLVGGLEGIVPLDIAVQTNPGKVTAAIVVGFTKALGNGEDGILRKGIVGVNGSRVKRGRGLRIQELFAGNRQDGHGGRRKDI